MITNTRFLMIYEETGAGFNPKQPIVEFGVGKTVSRKQLNKFFAEAAKLLNVPEARLVYEIFD